MKKLLEKIDISKLFLCYDKDVPDYIKEMKFQDCSNDLELDLLYSLNIECIMKNMYKFISISLIGLLVSCLILA